MKLFIIKFNLITRSAVCITSIELRTTAKVWVQKNSGHILVSQIMASQCRHITAGEGGGGEIFRKVRFQEYLLSIFLFIVIQNSIGHPSLLPQPCITEQYFMCNIASTFEGIC